MGPLEGNQELNPAGLFLQSRPASIYAGSNDIQRNILAKNVLELPGQGWRSVWAQPCTTARFREPVLHLGPGTSWSWYL